MGHWRCSAITTCVTVGASLLPAVASAQDARIVAIQAQPLATSLQAIAQRFGVELLFSNEMVQGRFAPALTGRIGAQAALELVLAGSGLTIHKTSDGSYVVTAATIAQPTGVAAVPEILVIGRQTHNADIERTENDVRPYQVISSEEVADSHSATMEELAAKRLPANAQGATLGQQPSTAQGETASSINLRGLGTGQTLILVDGRRLPSMPDELAGLIQSDINALSPESIERVETITATAGGIYGPGATAGVINLVLHRDYRGLDLAVTHGVTARGDAPYSRVDARLGFTPDHGATDVMLAVSLSNFDGLAIGARDYALLSNERYFANNPAMYAALEVAPSPSLNIMSQDGSALVFKPGYGGAALNSPYTYVAPADGRSNAALQRQLTANAGSLDLRPSNSAAGGESSLLSSRRTSSIIANIRHRSGPFEIVFDFLRLENHGHAVAIDGLGAIPLAANDPANPFEQAINVIAPGPEQRYDSDFHTLVTRADAGLIVNLPGKWRAEADYSLGLSRRTLVATGATFNLAGLISYYAQYFGGVDTRNPLGNYSTFLSSFNGDLAPQGSSFDQVNHFNDATGRIAGPIAKLDGGPLTATILVEARREHVAGGSTDSFGPLIATTAPTPLPAYTQTTRSIYSELRAPLVDAQSDIAPLRGLELQLAVRSDFTNSVVPLDDALVSSGSTRSVRDAAIVYTAGFKVSPHSGILLRGSISTGEQPLTVDQLARKVIQGGGFNFQPDPKRGNTVSYTTFDVVVGGALDAKPEKARSISAGVVVQPNRIHGLRLSVDYTRITKSREIVDTYEADPAYFIANEALYPGRVTRAPLTPADAALGYTGGVITQVDTSDLSIGGTTIDAIDTQLDWRLPTANAGVFTLFSAATWQPRFRRTFGPGVPSVDFRDQVDGAPTIRGDGGLRWSKGPLSLTVSGQMTGAYQVTSGGLSAAYFNSQAVASQGSNRIPAQATFDLAFAYRLSLPGVGFAGRARTMQVRFGIQDLLDRAAPTMVNAEGGYSVYADPRGRRFELTVATKI